MKFSKVITGDHNTTYQQEQHWPCANCLIADHSCSWQSRCFSFFLGSKILLSSFANREQHTLPDEWLEILATLCNKVRFLLSTTGPTSGFHASCFPGLGTLNYSPLGLASLPIHVIFPKKIMLEKQPHLWLQLAALKGCHTGTLLLPVVGLQKGVRVLCWGVLLRCFSEFFHISLVWMSVWKSLLN